MKKIILLCSSILIFSCSPRGDEIFGTVFGTWYLVNDFNDGTDVATNCSRTSTLTINDDLSMDILFYEEATNNDCNISEQNRLTLEQISTSRYVIIGGNPDEEIIFNGSELLITNTNDSNTYKVFGRE